jgi:hypothetical protein
MSMCAICDLPTGFKYFLGTSPTLLNIEKVGQWSCIAIPT